MTRKEELLLFIETINEETQMLKTSEKVITSDVESQLINDNDLGTKTFNAPNEHIINLITNGFSDDLVGSVGSNPSVIEILDWNTIQK